ncbi:MAG: hypothetical protein IT385_26515 [Deltaproteobacteria bacterium]|nr:hypothetical protein [Deltaproteobacteria bacterium]
MPWLLILFGVAVVVAGALDPDLFFWFLLLVPAWLVLVPLLFPPAERKIAKAVDTARARRDVRVKVAGGRPGDPTAGLSLTDDDHAGGLALAEPAEPDASPAGLTPARRVATDDPGRETPDETRRTR